MKNAISMRKILLLSVAGVAMLATGVLCGAVDARPAEPEAAKCAEMPYMNLLKPDMIFVDGAANSSGRIKVKLSSCRCMLREIFV